MRTEIDGMEFDSATPAKGHMGLIVWQGPGKSHSLTCSPGVYQTALGFDATEGFHTYGFEWTERASPGIWMAIAAACWISARGR